MRIRNAVVAFLAAIVLWPAVLWAGQTGVALTIYNQNFGVVRETRLVNVPQNGGTIHFADVAALIDGTSVQFRSLTDPAARVLEQNYEYDLVSADKLLQKHIDQQITVWTRDGSHYTGRLLSFDPKQLVLRQGDLRGGIVMIQRADNVKDIQFDKLPAGLITKPTLLWKLATQKTGSHLVEVAYQTGGLNWRADYNAVLNPEDTALDLSGWVTINNQSGATYLDARLKLIAGDVRRVQPPEVRYERARMPMVAAAPPPFEEKPFFEYHLYTLDRPTTVAQNQTKQIELLRSAGVPVKKIFIYEGAPQVRFHGGVQTGAEYGRGASNKKVNVTLEFKNTRANNLGMPLPRGKVRLYKRDAADGALEFVGEDPIDHTPRDERIKLHVGDAFDLVGERKRTGLRVDTARHLMTESFEVRVRNHKEEAVKVQVKETLYRWSTWEITQSSHSYEKKDANTIHFPVQVGQDGEEIVTYTVRYTW